MATSTPPQFQTIIESYSDEDLFSSSTGRDNTPDHSLRISQSELDVEGVEDQVQPLRPMKILIFGRTGSGKSTFINSVFKQLVAETREGVAAQGHLNIAEPHKYEVNGIEISLYDTRGLGDPTMPYDKFFKEFSSRCRGIKFDLILICVKLIDCMDTGTIKAINQMADIFGKKFWECSIFLLTFTNMFEDMHRNLEPQDLIELVERRKEETKSFLRGLFKVENTVFDEIPFCYVGWMREGQENEDKDLLVQKDWLNDMMRKWKDRCGEGTKLSMSKVTEAIIGSGTGGVVVGTVVGGVIGGAVGTGLLPIAGTLVGATVGAAAGGVVSAGVASITGGTITNLIEKKLEPENKE